jgi:alpha/beta superfamily hydrolase
VKRHRYSIYLCLALFIATLLSGCQAVEPQPAATSGPNIVVITNTPGPTSIPTATRTPIPSFDAEDINFTTSDGLRIVGKLYRGGGDLAVILAHQRDGLSNQNTWKYFAQELATKGYTVLTFNFRGISGSEGDIDAMENLVVEDTRAAIEFLAAEGLSRVVCIGAEMGGTSCIEAATTHELSGLVVITAVLSLGEPTVISNEDLNSLTMPKLFICSENNKYGRIPGHMQTMFDESPEPKEFVMFPGEAHGTEMFFTSYKEEFRQLLLGFLEEVR